MPFEFELTPVEARILGSLVEKELTTPEYYPLTLNSLILACNQKSNRDPFMTVTEPEAQTALVSLKSKQLIWQRNVQGARSVKYEHNLVGCWMFSADETALLCVLLLRGPQTVGELRTRTERMHEFAALADVETSLQHLMSREEGPFIKKLPRLPGHKENRYDHLFCGDREPSPSQEPEAVQPQSAPAPSRFDTLEEQVRTLQDEVQGLKVQFAEFKKQFE